MKQSNPWKNGVLRFRGQKLHVKWIFRSHYGRMYAWHHGKPLEICMQGCGGDKIFHNFIDETCTSSPTLLESCTVNFGYKDIRYSDTCLLRAVTAFPCWQAFGFSDIMVVSCLILFWHFCSWQRSRVIKISVFTTPWFWSTPIPMGKWCVCGCNVAFRFHGQNWIRMCWPRIAQGEVEVNYSLIIMRCQMVFWHTGTWL